MYPPRDLRAGRHASRETPTGRVSSSFRFTSKAIVLARHPAPVIRLGQVHPGQLPRRHPGRLGVQEVVQDDAVEDGLQPHLHGAGQRAGDRPAVPHRTAVLDHRQPQVGPPPPPARGIGDRRADVDRVGADERLVRDLDAVHRRIASHTEPAGAAGRPTRLNPRYASQHRGEARTVREFSVPASFTVGDHDNVVSSVFAHERDDPDHVIIQRLVERVVDRRHLRPGRRPSPFDRPGIDRRRRRRGRSRGHTVRDALRVADHRLRHPVRRRGHRADLRDLVGRAGALRALRLRRGAGLRRDRRACRHDRAAQGRTARTPQGAADRRLHAVRARRARRDGRGYGRGRSSTHGCRPSSRPMPRR